MIAAMRMIMADFMPQRPAPPASGTRLFLMADSFVSIENITWSMSCSKNIL
jgi:hypothetical protein